MKELFSFYTAYVERRVFLFWLPYCVSVLLVGTFIQVLPHDKSIKSIICSGANINVKAFVVFHYVNRGHCS